MPSTSHLEDNAAGRYLADRGLPLDLCREAKVRYLADWRDSVSHAPRPALLFQLQDAGGKSVAVHGHYIDGLPGAALDHTLGPWFQGVFGTPGALTSPYLLITRSPLDALALATAGYPAVATCKPSGNLPDWLLARVAGSRVYIALENDPVSEANAGKLAHTTMLWGCRPKRLRANWNEALRQEGRQALSKQLAVHLGPPPYVITQSDPKSDLCSTTGNEAFDPFGDGTCPECGYPYCERIGGEDPCLKTDTSP